MLPAMSPAADDAKTLMADRCAVCHGENGDGQGPTASSMNPPPRNFHDPKWQKSVSDKTIAKAIVDGGSAVGVGASMPGNPDLASRPDLVAAMVKQIRAWGK
jgi:mono/diheme cytochrome c family protein